jgi:hypothetical protein
VNLLFAAAAELQQYCDRQGWKSVVIGGLAVQRWGEPRQTRDVDLALLTGLGAEHQFVDVILQRYKPRRPDARQFALQHRVLLVESASGIAADISLSALPYEARVIDRASAVTLAEGCTVRACSAEDLVVLKAFADRPQDWLDIEGIIVRQGAALDRTLALEELRPLLELKEDLDPEHTLRKLFRKHPAR